MNVSPALSPDGSQLVFLSERDGYSIDVFLADAATGAVTRKLVSTAADPHFDSLQFLESAGAWDAEGGRFALATLQRARPVLTILNMPGGSVRRERTFEEVDQIFSPTWSPDGRRIAFSAMSGGTSDLYEYDLEHDKLRRLTHDAYADLQPAWSPDGRTLAFVTDRFTSSIDELMFGSYRLALLDVAGGSPRPLPSLPDAKHIDPHWVDDSLFFVADAPGTSNIFRLDVKTGELRQVTDVRQGVSGITGLSPAISVSSRTDRLAFSEYRAGGYEIRITSIGTRRNRTLHHGTRSGWQRHGAAALLRHAGARARDARIETVRPQALAPCARTAVCERRRRDAGELLSSRYVVRLFRSAGRSAIADGRAVRREPERLRDADRLHQSAVALELGTRRRSASDHHRQLAVLRIE